MRQLALVAFEGIDLLGKGAIPLLIIRLGYSLKKIKVSDLKHSIVGSCMRIIGPAIAFAMVGFFRYIGWSPWIALGNKIYE